MKKIDVCILSLFTVLILVGCDSNPPMDVYGTKNTKESTSALLEKTIENHTRSYEARVELTTQIKVLTISLFVAIVGFSFSVTNEQKGVLLFLACFLCLFMYGLDTTLLDLSKRQLKFRDELQLHLLQRDSLSPPQRDSVINKTFKGIEEPAPCSKIILFFTPRAFDWTWYGMPALVALFMGWSLWWKWLQETRMWKWLQEKRRLTRGWLDKPPRTKEEKIK